MRQSILGIVALLLAGQAQANTLQLSGGNIAISAGNIQAESIIYGASSTLVVGTPVQIIQQPIQDQTLFIPTGQPPSLNVSVSGSLYYSASTANGYNYGSFSESGSSNNGLLTSVELQRQGFGYNATASSEVGSLHARASTIYTPSTNAYGNSSASATASFSDWFVISGGTGSAYSRLDASLDGSLAGGGFGSASATFNISYTPQNFCYWWSTCEASQFNQMVISENHSVDGRRGRYSEDKLWGEFAFTYDQPFQLTSTLTVSAANGGSADYYDTAMLLGFNLPTGAELRTLSGAIYAPVPEPEAWAMLLAGLGLMGLITRRRSRR